MNYSEAGYMVTALQQFFLQPSFFIKVDSEIKIIRQHYKSKSKHVVICVQLLKLLKNLFK